MEFGRFSSCWAVPPSLLHQVASAQHFIRPHEVAHLIVPARPRTPYEELFGVQDGIADRVGAFMRANLRYEPDPPTFDRWCSPASTLRKRAGDCDDLALLGLSLILAAGGRGEFVIGTHVGTGHAWVQGSDELGDFRFEATTGEVDRTPAWLRLWDAYSATAFVSKHNWRLAARHALSAF
jgi:hypothetical protein